MKDEGPKEPQFFIHEEWHQMCVPVSKGFGYIRADRPRGVIFLDEFQRLAFIPEDVVHAASKALRRKPDATTNEDEGERLWLRGNEVLAPEGK